MPKLLEDEFCNSLGSNYQPYGWVEAVCDEMVEDHAKDILDTISFYKQVAATGLTPSETVTEMICRERFACPKDSSNASPDEL